MVVLLSGMEFVSLALVDLVFPWLLYQHSLVGGVSEVGAARMGLLDFDLTVGFV